MQIINRFSLFASTLKLTIIVLMVFFYGCTLKASETKQLDDLKSNKQIKNLILMIGDGMGPQQLGLLMEYARWAKSGAYQHSIDNTAMTRFSNNGYLGLSTTHPADVLVTDSACSATQLASGVASRSEMLGLNLYGNPVPSILELAKLQGKSTGLVSDTRISHATPAAFASHQRHRSLENAIALEMLSSDKVDVMLSGGLQHWLPETVNTDPKVATKIAKEIKEPNIKIRSKRTDTLNLLHIAKSMGYQLAFNRSQLIDNDHPRVIGLFASSGMCDAIAMYQKACEYQPTLADMSKQALEQLEKNPDGFFLMIEAGQIDWAGHNNDAGQLLHEMLRFDQAIAAVYDWVKDRNDTLVVITADHETGGFGFSYSRKDIPKPQSLPGKMFENHLFQANFNFGDPGKLDLLFAQKKSFAEMWKQAKKGKSLPTENDLLEAVNQSSAFKITPQQAKNILSIEINKYQKPGHRYLSSDYFPKVKDFEEFYVYASRIHLDLIGRELSPQQNIVWSTGTHTDTPVPVISWWPGSNKSLFPSIQHHTELGSRMIEVFLNTGSNSKRSTDEN